MVDTDDGIELKFIPIEVINRTKIAKIVQEDVEKGIDYWQSAVICSALGANPPFEVIQGFIKRIWAGYELDKIVQVQKWVFLLRFFNLQDKHTVVHKGTSYFDAKPFLVKGWNPEMDLKTEKIKSLPIWVQFLDLDVKFWGNESPSNIGSILGILLRTDKYTRDKTLIRYARLLIDISLEGTFP